MDSTGSFWAKKKKKNKNNTNQQTKQKIYNEDTGISLNVTSIKFDNTNYDTFFRIFLWAFVIAVLDIFQ